MVWGPETSLELRDMLERNAREGTGPRMDGLAVTALVTGILSVLGSVIVVGLVLGPAAAIMGLVAYRQIASSNGGRRGEGIAIAGVVLGIVGFVASLLVPGVLLLGAVTTGGWSSTP
jgi:hypothetical protein